jgi:hypothetical protein
MSGCDHCKYWTTPRGFQRPADYAATSSKLSESLAVNQLAIVSNSGFEGAAASERKWPSDSIHVIFECMNCREKFTLFVDVDACRGGFHVSP